MVFLSESDFEKMNRILSINDKKPKKKNQSQIFETKKNIGRTNLRDKKIKTEVKGKQQGRKNRVRKANLY
jgi:hypothetical protein